MNIFMKKKKLESEEISKHCKVHLMDHEVFNIKSFFLKIHLKINSKKLIYSVILTRDQQICKL